LALSCRVEEPSTASEGDIARLLEIEAATEQSYRLSSPRPGRGTHTRILPKVVAHKNRKAKETVIDASQFPSPILMSSTSLISSSTA